MIDIIIPAYNAFDTIGKTLSSIAKQINREQLNVYIINDGSSKSYDYIIKNFSSLINIKEIIIENSGPGRARQVGLESSSNEFILFMDADDVLYNEFSIINLLSIISDNDIAQGFFIQKTETDEKVMSPQYCYLHGKLFRRSIIKKNKIVFDETMRYEGDIYEDTSFSILYSLFCKKIKTTEEIVYVYEYNPNSITKSNNNTSKNLNNYIDAMDWLIREVKKSNNYNIHDYAWNLYMIMFHTYFHYLYSESESNFVFNKIKEIKKEFIKYSNEISYDEQLSIYWLFEQKVIPNISFYDFIDRIGKEKE